MKKIVLFALVLVLIAAFAFTAFQAPVGGADDYAAGWNSRRAALNTPADAAQTVSFRIAPPLLPLPNVGWNS